MTSRCKRRDRGETAGRHTLEGAKRSCVTRKRGKSGRKGQISRKGANLRVRKWRQTSGAGRLDSFFPDLPAETQPVEDLAGFAYAS